MKKKNNIFVNLAASCFLMLGGCASVVRVPTLDVRAAGDFPGFESGSSYVPPLSVYFYPYDDVDPDDLIVIDRNNWNSTYPFNWVRTAGVTCYYYLVKCDLAFGAGGTVYGHNITFVATDVEPDIDKHQVPLYFELTYHTDSSMDAKLWNCSFFPSCFVTYDYELSMDSKNFWSDPENYLYCWESWEAAAYPFGGLRLNEDALDVIDTACGEALYHGMVDVSPDVYTEGYNQGFRVGRSQGYQEGKIDGYQLGLETNPSNIVTSLFGAIIDVPLKVVDGLTPFAVWDTPIVTIIISFLFVAVVLWFIKKVF